ncbi:MAG: hypothetical protein ACK400_00020, partial [Pseudanabaena sp.]
ILPRAISYRGRHVYQHKNPTTIRAAVRAAILFLGFDFVITQSTVAIITTSLRLGNHYDSSDRPL